SRRAARQTTEPTRGGAAPGARARRRRARRVRVRPARHGVAGDTLVARPRPAAVPDSQRTLRAVGGSFPLRRFIAAVAITIIGLYLTLSYKSSSPTTRVGAPSVTAPSAGSSTSAPPDSAGVPGGSPPTT